MNTRLFVLSAITLAVSAYGGGGGTVPASLVAQPSDDNPFVAAETPVSEEQPTDAPREQEPVASPTRPPEPLTDVPVTIVVGPLPESDESAPVVTPEPEQSVPAPPIPEPEPIPEANGSLTDPSTFGLHTPATPMNPDRDNNGVPYLDKPAAEGVYATSEQFSVPDECPTEPTCEPWIWTVIDFTISWPDVEQATLYNVYGRDWDPEATIVVADLPVPHNPPSYSFTQRLADPDIDTVVSQTTYQIEAKDVFGHSSGYTAPVTWTEVFP